MLTSVPDSSSGSSDMQIANLESWFDAFVVSGVEYTRPSHLARIAKEAIRAIVSCDMSDHLALDDQDGRSPGEIVLVVHC